MRTEILHVSKREISHLISPGGAFNLDDNEAAAFRRCLRSTASIWLGKNNGQWVCIWGLILPSMADNRPYLWLHVTDKVKECEFTFVRQSQIAVRKLLEQFPVIYGHCQVDAEQSIRWVKWLGAEFGQAQVGLIPFWIERK